MDAREWLEKMRKKRDRRELRQVFFFGIETQARSGDALDAGDNSLAVGTVFEFDGQVGS